MDDLTAEEEIGQDIEYLVENNPTSGLQTHIFKPPRTQTSIEILEQACQDWRLIVNEKKTQLLSIYSAKAQQSRG